VYLTVLITLLFTPLVRHLCHQLHQIFNITDDESNPNHSNASNQTSARNHDISESIVNTRAAASSNGHVPVTTMPVMSTVATNALSVLTSCNRDQVARNQNRESHLKMPSTVNRIELADTSNAHVCKTYSLMGDNMDTNIKPRYKRTDGHQGESLHY